MWKRGVIITKNKYVGAEVIHKMFGKGKIVCIDERHATVSFESKDSKFEFPKGFGASGFIRFIDKDLQAEVENIKDKYLAEETAEKRRLFVERAAEREKAKKASKNKGNERSEVLRKTLSYGDSFNTHADALNSCFGYHYIHYQRPYKNVEDKFGVWFPSIARFSRGKYVATETSAGWINVISEGGNVITEKSEDAAKNVERPNDKKLDRFVFAKMDGETYTFIGVYRCVDSGNIQENGFKYERIGTKVYLPTMEIT